MFVEFDQMPEDARIWIYQADRRLSDVEVDKILASSTDFLTQWSAHGNALKSSAKVLYNRFLLICIDEKHAQASGCSIDSCVHYVQSLGQHLNVDFFNRKNIAFLVDEKILVKTINEIRENTDGINADSQTFNNLIQTKSELRSNWIIPVHDSWLKKYFRTQNV